MNAAALATLALVVAAPVTAAPGTLSQCASVDAAEARLACYDAVAGRTPRPGTHGEIRETASAAAAVPPSAPTAAARRDDAANFGLSSAQLKVEPSGPSAIQAHIAGLSTDRIGNAIVTLDNGQTWILSDNDSRLAVGEDVSIKRAALGSFLMTTPDRHAYRVRRTR
jgi:hypothetical protein